MFKKVKYLILIVQTIRTIRKWKRVRTWVKRIIRWLR